MMHRRLQDPTCYSKRGEDVRGGKDVGGGEPTRESFNFGNTSHRQWLGIQGAMKPGRKRVRGGVRLACGPRLPFFRTTMPRVAWFSGLRGGGSRARREKIALISIAGGKL